jgi:hypothetical protein
MRGDVNGHDKMRRQNRLDGNQKERMVISLAVFVLNLQECCKIENGEMK